MPFRNPRFRASASSSISTSFLLTRDHSNQLFRKHRVWGLPPLEISSRQKRGHLRCRCLPPGTTPWSACGIRELELSYAGDPDERCVSRAPEGVHRPGPNCNAGMHRSRVDHTKGQKEITNSRPPGWHKRRGRQRGTHTFRLCRSRADHGNLGRRDPRTGYRRNLFCGTPLVSARENGGTDVGTVFRSPLSSASHVSMTAPGIGAPLVSRTCPSTYMYSPFPSDAIDSLCWTAVYVSGKSDRGLRLGPLARKTHDLARPR